MVYIIQIPLFYQTTSYPFPTTSDLPTTTAPYIAIPSVGSPSARAVFLDCEAWGWHVEHWHVDDTAPEWIAWWDAYKKKAKGKGWEDDLWRIWQREHGVRILMRERVREAKEGVGSRKRGMYSVVKGIEGVGRWVRRNALVRESTEWELRGLEERRTAEASRGIVGPDRNSTLRAQASTISLPGSVVERLEGLRVSRRASE